MKKEDTLHVIVNHNSSELCSFLNKNLLRRTLNILFVKKEDTLQVIVNHNSLKLCSFLNKNCWEEL